MTAQLQQEQTRYHENVKPRFSNPTYASTNVGSTLGMHVPFIYRSLSNRYSLTDLQPASRDRPIPVEPISTSRRASSQLSHVGTASLASLNRYISDRQVYEKQQKNYNIINVQPREYKDTINLFPKYRLENSDVNYYKKMKIESQISAKLGQFKPQSNPQQVVSNSQVPKRGKYLNNVDEVKDII